MTFGHFLLGSHNPMVTALGSRVKWPRVKLTIEGGDVLCACGKASEPN